MNLLIYVTALLLSLSALSYQSLSRYQSNADKEKFWNRRLRVDAVCAYNERVRDQYDDAKEKPDTKPNDKPENDKPQQEAFAKINLKFLISNPKEDIPPDTLIAYENVAKRLIRILYGEQPFFKNLLNKNPNLLDQRFPALRKANSEMKKPIGLVKNLSNIPLPDEDLKSLWYNLCKKAALGPTAMQALDPMGHNEDNCSDTCFTNFLGVKGTKIRVYLAKPALLFALYEEEGLVKQIIEKREELYKQAKNKSDLNTLSQDFKGQFQGKSPYDDILDFSVSTSDPR
jgi:hypothetical protein